MPNKLRFILEPLPHPHPQTASSEFEAWGRLSIYVLTDTSRHLLLRTQWNLEMLAEWFCGHSADLCKSHRELEAQRSLPHESLAQRNWRLRQHFDYFPDNLTDEQTEEIDAWAEALSASSGHTLNSMLPGAGMPPLVVGCHNGSGEISFVPEAANSTYQDTEEFSLAPGTWAFAFDMADFLIRLRAILILFLRVWLQSPRSPSARVRMEQLLVRLEAFSEYNMLCCQ